MVGIPRGEEVPQRHDSLCLFIEHALAAVAMFDCSMRYMAASKRWMDDYHLEQQDIIGKSHYEVFPEITEYWKKACLQGLRGEVVTAKIDRFERKNGTVQWLNWEIRPWYTETRAVGGIVISTEDVTENKMADNALVPSEARFRLLFENMNAGFVLFEVLLDSQGTPIDLVILAANRNFEVTTGLHRANVIGKRLTEVLPGIERDSADWIGTYGKVALSGEPSVFEQRSDLLGIYYSVSAYQAAPNQCAVTFRDVTEQREALVKLKLWAESFEKSHLALAMTDALTNQFILVNPVFAEERGYTQQELIGKSVLSVFPQDKVEEFNSKMVLLDIQTHLMYEGEHITKDGHRFPVLLDITTILSEDGTPLNRIAYAVNMTDIYATQQQLKLWAELFEKADFGLAISDATTNRFISVNPAYAREHGYDRTELEGRDIVTVYPNFEALEGILAELQKKSHFVAECEHNARDGHCFPVQVDITTIYDRRGMPDKRIIYSVDITQRKLSEYALLQHIDFTEGVMNAIPDLMFELDLNGQYINLWAHDPALLAKQKEALLGKSVSDVLPAKAAETVMIALKEAWVHGKSKGQVICLDLPHGQCWFELSTAKMSTKQIQHQHFIMLSREITDRKLAEERIQQLAYYDYLTALPNRRLFRDRLEQEIKRIIRNRTSLALLFLDLDKFKEVNDTLGHDKGDILLIETAKRIRKHIRDTDTLARLGGDEFAIILPEYEEKENIDRVIQSVLKSLEMSFDLGGGTVAHLSGSIGVALYPQDAGNIDDLLKHSDQAMYAAKYSKTARFNYFTQSMQDKARHNIDMTNDLRKAIELKQLEVYFQPIVDARSGRIVKAEALLRWHHPVLGMINPGDFIPLAEESGLILSIGEWVFEESLRNISKWRDNTGQLIQVSVNKSSVQFMHGEVHRWHESYLKSGLPENTITVEITESLLLSDSERVRNKFKFFKEHGIELSIDDFGTGFSALSYLNQFDVDYLKIDKSFVQKMVTDSSSRALSEAIIIMAHKLGIKTIAEGVETNEQREMLQAFCCDYLQGYLYSKPIPASMFESLLMAG